MHIVVVYHGLDNQCIAVRMVNLTCVSFTKDDIFHLTFSLLGRPLVGRAHGCDRPYPDLFEVAVLGSSRLSGEVRSIEDGSNLARRSCLALVLVGFGALVVDIILEVSLSNELLNLFFEGNAFFRGVADILVVSTLLILVLLRAVSPHRIRSLVYARVLRGQEYILTRPCQVGEVIVLARRGFQDPLIRALGLLLMGVRRSSTISAFAFLVVPIILGGDEFSC